ADAEVVQRLRRVLARAAAAEVAAGDENAHATVAGIVERVAERAALLVEANVVEGVRPEAVERHTLQVARRDDAVGVDVVAGDVDTSPAYARDIGERHQPFLSILNTSRASAILPAIAAAATITGLINTVRPLGLPWRPLKLRFEDEAQSWSPISLSGFIARHIEQPASRHSKPAWRNTSSRPSARAAWSTSWDPGTTSAFTPGATRRPRTWRATSRKSESRAFVQLPMKVTSTGVPLIGAPGVSFMYSSASATPARSSAGLPSIEGTRWSMEIACPGLMPQVTVGGTSAARMSTTSS